MMCQWPQKKVYKTSQKHRDNSTSWHKKWVSKGVPRGAAKAKAKASSTASDRKPTLAKAKDMFISEWITKCDLPASNDRRTMAIKAWMDSDVRANLMAGRAGVQK